MGECLAKKMLSQYLDGEVSPTAAEGVRRHLARCRPCTKALREMQAVDEALRQEAPAGGTPDLAPRVTTDLRRRGAFLNARIAAGRRRLFGRRVPFGRMAAVVSVAASVLVLALVAFDHVTANEWARRTEPVLADAERVLVRLVLVEPEGQNRALARARLQARELGLSARLARARAGAQTDVAASLGLLERTFSLLAEGDDLPPDLVAQLNRGDLLKRTERLREGVAMAR